jgi:hypothetical protein
LTADQSLPLIFLALRFFAAEKLYLPLSAHIFIKVSRDSQLQLENPSNRIYNRNKQKGELMRINGNENLTSSGLGRDVDIPPEKKTTAENTPPKIVWPSAKTALKSLAYNLTRFLLKAAVTIVLVVVAVLSLGLFDFIISPKKSGKNNSNRSRGGW